MPADDDWQQAIDKLLPISYQHMAVRLELFLSSAKGLNAMKLLAITGREIVILSNANDPNRNSPSFILNGSGLNKVSCASLMHPKVDYRQSSSFELFSVVAHSKPNCYKFPGLDDLSAWLSNQLDEIAKTELAAQMA